MIILSENYKLSQVQMQMINFPESQIQPGSISTFHNFQSNSRSKESEVNHQTCNPPDFIFETSNNKKNLMLFRSNLQISRKSFSVAIFWSVPGSLVIKKF